MKKSSLFLGAFFGVISAEVFAKEDAKEMPTYVVQAKKFDESRNDLSPKTGNVLFNFDQDSINQLPLGQATPLNQVLQRAPNVVVNSQNQIHIRGDHSGAQYRINGVMLPDGVGGFGNSLDTHFADSIEFLTGAMPAQYGLRTSAVVDIKTKTGHFDQKNRSEITVGGNDTFGANQQVGGHKNGLDYYLSANYLQNSRGIESPTAVRDSIHDDTRWSNLFGYFSKFLNSKQRLSVIVANATNFFEIPNTPGLSANYNLTGKSGDSATMNQNQKEENRFIVASLQGKNSDDLDYQISLFAQHSDLKFKPDYVNDLVFNGVSSSFDRSSLASGIQADFVYKLNETNKLRSGFYFKDDRVTSNSENYVFDGTWSGETFTQDGTHIARRIDENDARNSQFYSVYLQNEWTGIDRLTVNYGARFDISHAYSNESQLSPRLGAIYDLSNKTAIHAGYARYFTPPSVAQVSQKTIDAFNNTSNQAHVPYNDPVKAERTHYFDAGLSHKATSHLTLGIDGYYKKIKNVLDEHQFGNSQLYSPFNYEKGKAFGAEFKVDYNKNNFASFANFAVQRAYATNIISNQFVVHEEEYYHIKDHNVRLDHVQTYTASLGASYLFKGTQFAADALYGSGLSTGTNNKNTMPSYWQFNGSVARDFKIPAVGDLNLRFSVLNATDEVYRYSNGTGIGIDAVQYAPRRTFYLITSKQF